MSRIMKIFMGGLLLAALVGMSLSGGSLAQEEKKPYAGTTLRLISWRVPWAEVLDKTLKEEICPEMGMKYEVHWYDWSDLLNKVVLDAKAKNPRWDLIAVSGQNLAELVEAGAIRPFGPLIDKHSNPRLLAMDDFISSEIKKSSMHGEQWTLPIHYNLSLLVYRKDLFNSPIEKKGFKKKYGYELQVPKLYEQYLDVAEFFTRKKGELLKGKPLENNFYGCVQSNKLGAYLLSDFGTWMYAWGCDNIYDEKMRVTLNSPQWISVIEYYTKLCEFMPPGHLNMTSGESSRVMALGWAAMTIEYDGRIETSIADPEESTVADMVDLAMAPSRRGVPSRAYASCSNLAGVAMYKYSKNSEAVYKALEKFCSREVMKKNSVRYVDYLGPRYSVVQDPDVGETKFRLDVREKMIPHVRGNPHFLGYLACWDIIGKYLHQAILHKMTPTEAADAMAKEVKELLSEYEYIE